MKIAALLPRILAGISLFACPAGAAPEDGSPAAKDSPDWREGTGGSEGQHHHAMTLNGAWEFAVGDGREEAQDTSGQAVLDWKRVRLPGQFMPWSKKAVDETAFVWVRRPFHLSAAQAKSLAVLRWNSISLGATAYINGREVGHNEPTGPYQTIIAAGILRAGRNDIVLKVAGTRGTRKSASGYHLFPAGFANTSGLPAITDDVWIDFADRAYLKWVLAIPDLVNSRVTIRVTPTGRERFDGLTLEAAVRPWPAGSVAGRGRASARLIPDPDPLGGEHFTVEVPMENTKPWTHENRHLYRGEVTIRKDGAILDAVTFRFGMREIDVSGRNFKLNGRNLWLRGSNLVFEWDWGDTITGHELDYLVTEAREMSMNSFRTHTRPPPRLWADICDEHGTMLLAEFPVLYNYQDYRFTPAELDTWHRNCLLDAAGWMARLWNHPSVVTWVLSNESRRDNKWEEGRFQDFVNELDPTRPTLRTGSTGTREIYDVHTCGNITDTVEGALFGGIEGWFRTAGHRATTNTEYMNYFRHPKTQWSGVDDQRADQVAVAQIGAEHTEAMRRARLDGIWPYMYAGWTRTRLAARVRETGTGSAVWKAGYAAPASACWHSSLSPVLASLDLFDAAYRPGQKVTTRLALINDSWHDAKIRVDLLLTRENPEFIPEAACFDRPVARWSHRFKLQADSMTDTTVEWKLPEEEGSYWLTARTTGLPGRPVLSQRFVRAVRSPQVPAVLRKRRLVVLGGDGADWIRSHDLEVRPLPNRLVPGEDVVVIWNPTAVTRAQKQRTEPLLAFARAGGRIVVLATREWNWPGLCDLKIGKPRGSRVFPYEGTNHPLLDGIPPEWLTRWNGLPGTVTIGSLQGAAMEHARKILWVREPKTCVAAEVPVTGGGGTILFSQLDVQDRVNRSEPSYDPVAERILVNLLASPVEARVGDRSNK